MELKKTEYEKLLSKGIYILIYIDVFPSSALYWMDQRFMIKTRFVQKGHFFPVSIFRLYPGLKLSFENNSDCRNSILSASFSWGTRSPLHENDQKYKYGGTIGFGPSCLECIICQSKVFRLHVILHETAGPMRSHSGEGHGYCYMVGRRKNSCLLGHITWLLSCFWVKLLLPSIFKSVDFWSSKFCIVLDTELCR